MAEHLFPDNTVLCNFAAVDRLDLLRSVLGGRGRWTEAVASEAEQSSSVHPCLGSLLSSGWLGEPIEVNDPADVRKVEQIRRAVFAGPDAGPLAHLGEAQTCYVIKNWKSFSGAWWISDDRDALRHAKFLKITTRETIDIMNIAVVDGDISAADAFALMTRMTDRDRALRLPSGPEELRR